MEGYLNRWINVIFRWTQEYFILHDDILVYCDKKGGKKIGCIHLKIASINSQPKDPLKILINSGTNEIQLKAQNATIKNQWLQAFIQAKKFEPQLNQSLQEIQQETQNNKNLSSYTKKLLLNTNINQLDQLLAQVWQSQAHLEEQLSILMPRLNKMEQCVNIAENIEKFSQQIKDNLTSSIFLIEDEWKHINKAYNLLNQANVVNKTPQFPSHSNLNSENNLPSNDITTYYNNPNIHNHNNNNGRVFNQENDNGVINETLYQSFDQDAYGYYSKNQNSDQQQQDNMNSQLLRSMSQSQQLLQNNSNKIHPLVTRNLEQNVIMKTMVLSNEPTRIQPPVNLGPQEPVSFWSILKNSIGKDLSKISFPVQLNEPLSMLQKMAEQFHYFDLLNKADTEKDSSLRLGYAMAFSISYFSTQLDRNKKPFNPLLHETYELHNENFTYLAEQVSHHPPITAAICFNKNFELQTTSQSKTQFLGHKMEIKPQSKRYLRLKKNNDLISYNIPNSTVHNIIMGKMYVDHTGDMNFKNEKTGDTGKIIFKEKSWNGKGQYELEGWIKNQQGQELYKLEGAWDKHLDLINSQTKQKIRLWEVDLNRYKQNTNYYNFTQFCLQLNYLHQNNLNIAPTDTRMRPDQRALELGKEDLASSEKNRLEQKQRAVRKQNQLKHFIPEPFWFKLDPQMGIDKLAQENFNSEKEHRFFYQGEYFKRDFNKCPDLY